MDKIFLLFGSILFFSIFKNVTTSEGVYLWATWYRISTFKCLKEKYSKEFVIILANYYDTGRVDLDAELNIINARAAGIENVDIYINPCVKPSTEYELCGNGSGSITKVLDYLNDNNIKFGRVWFRVDLTSEWMSKPFWMDKNKTSNIEFIEANLLYF
uniref:Uncharacterized protein n=1 Tax=Meloidogyne enterolobii TaxID=390850 RepID=A0A6V7XBC5_MELEN|nr:unnamed protein product [Meloidogyne enterolobii]